MNENAKFKFQCSAFCWVLFIIFTLMVKFVSVRAIGPNGSEIGFAGLNYLVNSFINGPNETWYNLSHALTICGGVMGFLICCFGVRDVIKAKTFKGLDKRYYLLAGTYAFLGLVYAFFEIVIVNYRPILVDDVLEASYPSSHCLLAIVVYLTAARVPELYRKSVKQGRISAIEFKIMAILSVIARVISGYHWATDVIGSVILAYAIVFTFDGILEAMPAQKNREVPEQE